MSRRTKRPERTLELITQYAAARVEQEKLYREVIMGVVESIDSHSRVKAHADELHAQITRDVYALAGILSGDE